MLRHALSCRVSAPAKGLTDPFSPVDEFVTETAPVAEEVAVHLAVETVPDPPQGSVPFAGDGVAADAAVDANRGSGLQVPLPGVVLLEGLVGKDPRGADLRQVAAELALQGAVCMAAEVDMGMERQRRRSPGPRRNPGRTGRSGNTGCSGSSRGSRRVPGPG